MVLMAQDNLLDFDFQEIPLATSSDDYYTPKWVFDALGLQFDIDVASPVGGISWIPAKRYFTQYDDGLAQDWGGSKVWMNPPYSKPAPWIDKWLENGNGVCLLAASRSYSFLSLWANCDALLFLPLLKFVTGMGKQAGIYMPTVLAAIGAENVVALKASGIGFVR